MGLYAAKSAVVVAAQLNLGNTAARLFVHMALECWDDVENPAGQAPRRYFGRRDFSALGIGFRARDADTDAAHQAVKRATRELVDKGAIVRVRRGGNGQPAEFELQVDSTHEPRTRHDPIPLRPIRASQGVTSLPPRRVSF